MEHGEGGGLFLRRIGKPSKAEVCGEKGVPCRKPKRLGKGTQ